MAPEEIIAKVLGLPLPEVSDDTSNKTVATWDSLAHIVLVLELEATYGVSFTPDELFNMTSLTAIKQVLRTHGADW